MTMSKDSKNIIKSHTLENGLLVNIIDQSRLVAGDRWYVKIICETEGPYSESQCKKLLTSEQFQFFKEKYPDGKLVFTYEKERNFVDDGVKAQVLEGLVENIETSNLGYMAKQSFADNLLKKTIEEFIQEFATRKEMGLLGDKEEVEEPEDFSACFK